jgi:uncharacterized protein YdeI (YjbR/CyaY-like superfamily)
MTSTQFSPVEFRARLDNGVISMDGRPEHHWTAVLLPFKPAETWPGYKSRRVRGTINGHAIRTSLIPSRELGLILLVTKVLQKKAGLIPGSMIDVVLEPDLDDRSASPPPQLAKLFKEDREVKKWFQKLTYGTRKYICDEVAGRKSPEAATRRAEYWVECFMLTMEGEVEPPPILQAAFRRQPLARAGWEAMTPIQRRNNLLAIFQTQSPEARQKRLDYALGEALRVATKRKD